MRRIRQPVTSILGITIRDHIDAEGEPAEDLCWVCTWFGEVLRNPRVRSEALIKVLFTPVPAPALQEEEPDLLSVWDPSRSVWVEIGVGLLPGLHAGQVWQNGRHIATLEYTTAEFSNLRISEQRTRLVSDGGGVRVWGSEGYARIPILPRDQIALGRVPKRGFNGRGARCLSIPTDDRNERVLIPCTELIRFYYATSGHLSREIFNGFMRQVWARGRDRTSPQDLWGIYSLRPEHTGLGKDGSARLRLRKHMFDKDAPIVARLCFSDLARQRVLGVWESIQKNNNGVHRWPVLEVLPPFDGPTDLRVHGYRVTTEVAGRRVRYTNSEEPECNTGVSSCFRRR